MVAGGLDWFSCLQGRELDSVTLIIIPLLCSTKAETLITKIKWIYRGSLNKYQEHFLWFLVTPIQQQY